MNSLDNSRPKGLSRQAIKIWGMLFIIVGAVGQGIIMNKMLGMQGLESIEAMETVLESNEKNITLGIISLLMQMAYACAIPIYTFLMVDGFRRTSSVRNYALRVAGVALLTEIPYNLCMSGEWIDFGSRNPMLAMALGIVMMFIYNHYSGKKFLNIVIRIAVFLLGFVWVYMLKIEHGMAIVMMISTMWLLRKNRSYQVLGGSAMMFVCSAFPSMNPVYWLAPVVFLVVFYYNEEKGESNKIIEYLAMPVILLIVGLIAKYAI